MVDHLKGAQFSSLQLSADSAEFKSHVWLLMLENVELPHSDLRAAEILRNLCLRMSALSKAQDGFNEKELKSRSSRLTDIPRCASEVQIKRNILFISFSCPIPLHFNPIHSGESK